MKVAFISDLHLTTQRPQSTNLFVTFLKNSGKLFKKLYILGDFFEYWIGDDASYFLGYEIVESALQSITKAGLHVYLIPGNRDFLIGKRFEERTGCMILPDLSVIVVEKHRILLNHGDVLCTDDTEHLNFRKTVILSKEWKTDFLKKSINQRISIAKMMRSKSNSSTRCSKMAVNINTVQKLMHEHQVKLMVHGHVHRPAVYHFISKGVQSTRYVLGDWDDHKSVLVYNDGMFMLKTWDSL